MKNSRSVSRTYLKSSLRRLLPALAGLCVALEAGALSNFRKYPVAPEDGSQLTKRVTFPPAVVLGTRG